MLVFAAIGSPAFAEDGDLDRIPQGAPEESFTPDPNTQLYIQDDLELAVRRSALVVPIPPPPAPRWEDRLFFDARIKRKLTDGLEFVLSDRFNLRAEEGRPVADHESIRNDLREAYLAWQPGSATFIDLGRINVKNGVALGFNPTDFFKTRVVVEPLSADPSVLREDRLGALALMGQRVWQGGALTVVFAPKLYGKTAIYTDTTLPSFNPMLDRTNGVNRVLVKASLNLFDDISPEVLAYIEDGRAKFGLNLTRGFGQRAVGYLEWSGGDRANLVSEALAYGRATGTIPAAAPDPFTTTASRSFQNDLSIGASYTTESKITFNLEYHFHQAGFSGSDWQNWISRGSLHLAPLDAELWYIRAFAGDQQEPLAKNGLFLRADRQDAFVPNLEFSGIAFVDLRDGSGLVQMNADYFWTRQWTVGAQLGVEVGGKRTDFGSLPTAASAFLNIRRYF